MPVTLNYKQIEYIIKIRKELQLTQTEVCQKANISPRTLQDMEKQRRSSFNETTIMHICRALNINYDKLLEIKPFEHAEKSPDPIQAKHTPMKPAKDKYRMHEIREHLLNPIYIVLVIIVLTVIIIFLYKLTPQPSQPPAESIAPRTDWIDPSHKNHFQIAGS